jgi:hypothetical protein
MIEKAPIYIETERGIVPLEEAPKTPPRITTPPLVDGGVRDVTPKNAGKKKTKEVKDADASET